MRKDLIIDSIYFSNTYRSIQSVNLIAILIDPLLGIVSIYIYSIYIAILIDIMRIFEIVFLVFEAS